MQHVDAISRALTNSKSGAEVLVDTELNERWEVGVVLSAGGKTRICQSIDVELSSLIEELNRDQTNHCRNYVLKCGILYRKFNNKLFFVMPKSIRKHDTKLETIIMLF